MSKPRKPIPNFTWNDVRAAHNLHSTVALPNPRTTTAKDSKMNKVVKLAAKIAAAFVTCVLLAACVLMSGCQVNVISASPVTIYSDTNTNSEMIAAEDTPTKS